MGMRREEIPLEAGRVGARSGDRDPQPAVGRDRRQDGRAARRPEGARVGAVVDDLGDRRRRGAVVAEREVEAERSAGGQEALEHR